MAREDSYRGRSEPDYGRESSGRGPGREGPDYGREEWERNYGREGRLGREGGRESSSGPDFTRDEWRGGERGRQWEGGYESEGYGGSEFRGGARRREPGYGTPGDGGAGEYGARASESPWSGAQGGFTGGQQYGGGRYGGSYDYGGLEAEREGREIGRESFAGRGPRGYKRPDARINEDVCERLTRHPAVDATDIDVRVENGEVTLSGTVTNRREKRIVEDLVEDVSGVTDVRNEIRVSQGGAGRTAERETAVPSTREGRQGKSPQAGTEIRRATRSSTSGGTTRS